MALTLLRHTRPAGGDGVCYGRSDIGLAADVASEAEALAARLPRPDRIVTSPLARCRRLADHLGARLSLPVAIDPDWQEMDFGHWEGLPWSAVPRAELDAWAADLMHARPHGGESVAMLLARTRRALARCRAAPGFPPAASPALPRGRSPAPPSPPCRARRPGRSRGYPAGGC